MSRPVVAAAVLALAAAAGGGCTPSGHQRPAPALQLPAQASGPHPVSEVIDGDTVTVQTEAGEQLTIRMLGIDAPETLDPREPVGCYGPEASARTVELLAGSGVRWATDPSQPEVDRYGRTLAYVWAADDVLVNLVLLEEGYAREYTVGQPYAHQAVFRAAARAAESAEVGMWSPDTCNGHVTAAGPGTSAGADRAAGSSTDPP